MKKRTVVLLASAMMILGVGIGGSLAWLLDETETVTNTFTTSDIEITLTESANLDLKMVPGKTITKDPKVTVKATSEKCYVFVEIAKSVNYSTYLDEYEIADGWEKVALTDHENDVYYRVVDDVNVDQEFQVLKDNKVVVNTSVTKEQMNALDKEGATAPTLTFTAYAIQYDYLTETEIAKIWELANLSSTTE